MSLQMTRVLLSLFMARRHRVVPGAQSPITTEERFAKGKKATLPTFLLRISCPNRYVKMTQTALSEKIIIS